MASCLGGEAVAMDLRTKKILKKMNFFLKEKNKNKNKNKIKIKLKIKI